jgi:hypothetical protein
MEKVRKKFKGGEEAFLEMYQAFQVPQTYKIFYLCIIPRFFDKNIAAFI